MLTLFLDTSSSAVGIAIIKDGQLLCETFLNLGGKEQNRRLLPELHRLLQLLNLEIDEFNLLSCCNGPGSFTGVRTAVATIQGLAIASNTPCVAISSLAYLAMNLPYSYHPVCALLDARKNEVYAGLYHCNGFPEPLMHQQAIKPELLLETITTPTVFIGEGAIRYQQLISSSLGNLAVFVPAAGNFPRPAAGAMLAEQKFATQGAVLAEKILPDYLRLSEAEIARQKNNNN
ncbi:MAG: tRNA (adenosine(37)-N6)-threonylcarbamoyltransferase complex dimerization subunit type 1 TsaB [Trichlorobacter sp.]|nr:tRNA (adenosine(37)-N6)-threonylcarbamoyltransferase complex dimerization subunit type 1 TsaB [Trichlorobacter sp.]